jgi:chaperonin GroES
MSSPVKKLMMDRVLIEPATAEATTPSGIIIPDSAQEKPQKGTVVAVGPGRNGVPVTLKEGDEVLYGKYSGTEVQFNGKPYLFMREDDIFAVIK